MRKALRIIRRTKLVLGIIVPLTAWSQNGEPKKVEHAGMAVEWTEMDGRIAFALVAPTDGWVTIGFDEDNSIEGAYLIMARVSNGKAEVVEHYTSSPGKYQPITELGGKALVQDVEGREEDGETHVSFSLPIDKGTEYQRALRVGQDYFLIMAYSREDDFQHHSTTRTSIQINL